MPSKILFLSAGLASSGTCGGIQRYSDSLVKSLSRLGYDLRIVSVCDEVSSKLFPQSVACDSKALDKRIVAIWEFFRQILFFKPDLVLCGHANFSFLCYVAARLLGIRYVVFCYGIDVVNLGMFKRVWLRRAEKVVAISRYTRGLLSRGLGVPDEHIEILPPAVDSERFCPALKSEELMSKLGINPGDRVILTVARLSGTERGKGYDKVIAVLPELIRDYSEHLTHSGGTVSGTIKYILCGAGDDLPRLRSLIYDSNLDNSVILPGFVPDVDLPKIYNIADVFVMPSTKEGFGIVFVEALLCGKPVVLGNIDGSMDSTMAGGTAIFVNPDSAQDLKNAILRALQMPARDQMESYSQISKCFGEDAFTKRFRDLLLKTLP